MIEALVWFGLAALVVFTAAVVLSCLVAASRADDRADRIGYDLAVQQAHTTTGGPSCLRLSGSMRCYSR